MPLAPCPWCDALHALASDMQGTASPGPGDIAVCITCGQAAVYTGELLKRRLTDSDWNGLDQQTRQSLIHYAQAVDHVHLEAENRE